MVNLKRFVYNFFWKDRPPIIVDPKNAAESFAKQAFIPKREFIYGNLIGLLSGIIIPICLAIILCSGK